MHSYMAIWFSREPSVTTRMLGNASSIVDDLYIALTHLNHLPELERALIGVLDGMKWTSIPCAIRAARGAADMDKLLVVKHRKLIVRSLLGFFVSLQESVLCHNAGEEPACHRIRGMLDGAKAELLDYGASGLVD